MLQLPPADSGVAGIAKRRGIPIMPRGVALNLGLAGRYARPSATDLSKIVTFGRERHQSGTLLPPSIDAAVRPAPPDARRGLMMGVARGVALVAASLLLHGALLAMFWHAPRPMASIGIEAMTVEITLGATEAAGLARVSGEQEVIAPGAEPTRKSTEPSRVTTAMAQSVPVAAQDAAPPTEPREQPLEPSAAAADATASTQRSPEMIAVQLVAPAPVRASAPTAPIAAQQQPVAATATPADSASGVGRGRSDNAANYAGMVSAHLNRHQQYLAAARSPGVQGVVSVSFSIDGDGQVTSVQLAKRSGNPAIDQAAVATVHRASPFPRPDDGRGRHFTVRVRFVLR
jgi:periplasmic protein TonB